MTGRFHPQSSNHGCSYNSDFPNSWWKLYYIKDSIFWTIGCLKNVAEKIFLSFPIFNNFSQPIPFRTTEFCKCCILQNYGLRRSKMIIAQNWSLRKCQGDHHSHNPGLQPWKLSTCDHQRTTRFNGNRWAGQTFHGNQHEDCVIWTKRICRQITSEHKSGGGGGELWNCCSWPAFPRPFITFPLIWGFFNIGKPQKIIML
jgi:hypothetical protein